MHLFVLTMFFILLLAIVVRIIPYTTRRMNPPPRIACLVISSASAASTSSNDRTTRWRREYTSWKRRNIPHNVDLFFLECSPSPPIDDQVYAAQCVESFHPGIYQKTVQCLRSLVHHNKYDAYLRTNLNTYVDFELLSRELQGRILPEFKTKPLYTGGLHFWWGVSGTSILLNHTAARAVVEHGFEPEFYNAGYADDVVIANVLKERAHVPHTRWDGLKLYVWNFRKSIAENDKARSGCAFVRTKSIKEFDERVDNHLNKLKLK